MSHRPSGGAPSRLVAVLGPTNTGKTHLAVERMLGHASGMIGLPLRLLAREIYDRVVGARGPRAVALITGEEKIAPPRAHYFVCTVEAMPLGRDVEFLAVDEIQLAADPERGHVFTDRLLHARGRYETMLLGAATMAPLIRALTPDARIVTRERFSALSYAGARKVSRLPPRSAVVAFAADEVYAIAELIRRQRGGAAVVMGMLSPRTRNAQVALYQSGEVDFLVATDAIGMGLNMDVDHVAFAGLRKFDGRRARRLHAHEVGQIAGRAGRYRRDGTFGVTGRCEPMAEDLVGAVEDHRFEPVASAQWRNRELDFQSLGALLGSLSAPPARSGLKASQDALDEKTLRLVAEDGAARSRCAARPNLIRLWDACQTPDFRKTTFEDHVRLVRDLFDHLSLGARRVPDDWMAGQWRPLDRVDGEIDALSTRLAGVRTLAYIANRPDWLADPDHWREATLRLEDRLSDALHEKLMARFVDARTSALIRGLGRQDELLAGVAADGTVTVEGHLVGKLEGLRFEAAAGAGALARRALRAAAQRAVAPQVARRLGVLAAEPDESFALGSDGVVLWRGEAAGRLANDQPFNPRVSLYGDLGHPAARARAARRLEAFVAAEAGRRLSGLEQLGEAVTSGSLKGLARGLAYRLIEAGGAIARGGMELDLAALSKAERRALRSLGVRIGAFSLCLPAQLAPDARALAGAFAALVDPDWPAFAPGPTSPPRRLADPAPPARALGLRGLVAVGEWAVPVESLERLDAILRGRARQGEGWVLSPGALAQLGWSEIEAGAILPGLGFAPVGGARSGAPTAWRRRKTSPRRARPPQTAPASPFAALAVLKAAPIRKRRARRRRVRDSARA
jgi:ATP-dependent RNA helicase SUPV3L1/SUV3